MSYDSFVMKISQNTLIGHEISKIPNHFADEYALAAQQIESLEMLRKKVSLEFLRPNKRRQLKI
jgi:hypothetical protein